MSEQLTAEQYATGITRMVENHPPGRSLQERVDCCVEAMEFSGFDIHTLRSMLAVALDRLSQAGRAVR